MSFLHISDLEAAINWWRAQQPPSFESGALSAPLQALAELYGRMAYDKLDRWAVDRLPANVAEAWMTWYASTPDAPCIAICSTTQGDAVCKGCGRTFEEVQRWPTMSPFEKRDTWLRITRDGSAWRFNRYAERAQARE